jgi:hypothetical protein
MPVHRYFFYRTRRINASIALSPNPPKLLARETFMPANPCAKSGVNALR